EREMPLLDHFRPPVSASRHWEAFHGRWAHAMADALNGDLPQGYFSEAQVTLGGAVEVNVATLDARTDDAEAANGGGTATLTTRAPAVATASLSMPIVFPDEFEVRVFQTRTGPTLVAAVELVSPRNKDRPESRRAFIAKCLNYLAHGIGLIVVDIVTERAANLHDDLVRWMGLAEPYVFPAATSVDAVSYHPRRTSDSEESAEIRPTPLELGQPLPILSLALRGGPVVSLDLEATYTEARERSRM